MNNPRPTGAIIAGYPGVGKTTLASSDPRYVDLDSSTFDLSNRHISGAHIRYAEAAIELARKGYRVLISCHPEVLDYIASLNDGPDRIPLYTCSPALSMERKWIARLQERYNRTMLRKDLRALRRAEHHFKEDVERLQNFPGYTVIQLHNFYPFADALERLVGI